MNEATGAAGQIGRFDDRNVAWVPYPGLDGMFASIFHVDEARNSVDFLLRFAPNTKSVIHEHLAFTHTFVVEGDHVIYEPDGTLRESRPVGHYAAGMGGESHDEGGGPNGAVIFYSVRGDSDRLFEIRDLAGNTLALLRTADFKALFDASRGG